MLQIPEQTNAAGLTCDFCVRSLRASSSPTLPEGLPRDLHAHHPYPRCWTLFWLSRAPSRPHLCAVSGQGWAEHSGSLSPGLTASQKRQELSVPMGRHPTLSGVTASPGVPAAPPSSAPSWGSLAPTAPHRTQTPVFCNNLFFAMRSGDSNHQSHLNITNPKQLQFPPQTGHCLGTLYGEFPKLWSGVWGKKKSNLSFSPL